MAFRILFWTPCWAFHCGRSGDQRPADERVIGIRGFAFARYAMDGAELVVMDQASIGQNRWSAPIHPAHTGS
jgi:hypothetical protein